VPGYINLDCNQHEGLVYYDVDWSDARECAVSTGRFVAEVEDWCKANLRGEYAVLHTQVCAEKFRDMVDEFELEFDDDLDLIMFKMRWL